MRPVFAFVLLALAAGAHAQQPADPHVASRGELLYADHCIECHTQQMHWRDKRLAHDWDSLKAQVRHWQEVARLQWDDEDVDAVARYLNGSIYHFTETQARR